MSVRSSWAGLVDWLKKDETYLLFLRCALLLIVVLYFGTSLCRRPDNDEYEHLHKAWLMKEGVIPLYRLTYLHSPMLEWLTIPIMRVTGESAGIFRAMRTVMFLISCGSLWLMYRITRRLFESPVQAILAVLLLLSNTVWIMKSFEIRPDNLMLVFALLSFLALMRYYAGRSPWHLLWFGACAALSVLGKQNAAIYLLPVSAILVWDTLIRARWLGAKTVVVGLLVVAALLMTHPAQSFLAANMRHLVPDDNKFWPWNHLRGIWDFNRVAFLLFLFQLFGPLSLAEKYRSFKPYLVGIPLTCFTFLFLMNRPFFQEMIVMTVFACVVASNLLVAILRAVDWKIRYAISLFVIAPAVITVPCEAITKPMADDLAITRAILEISQKNEQVFDAYGKAVFRPHPLDPAFLVYHPEQFLPRFDALRRSSVKYVIKDGIYFDLLPRATLDWIGSNFTESAANTNILVRKTPPAP